MSLSIQIPDAEFVSAVTSLTQPSLDGLVAEFVLGDSEAKSIVNWADPAGATLTPVGSPVYGKGYAEVQSGGSGDVGFDLPIAPPAGDATMIVVVQKVTGCPVWLSTNSNFTGFHNYNNAPLLYNSQSGAAANVANVAIPSHSDFAFFAGKMPIAGLGKIYTYDGGVLTTDTAESAGTSSRPTVNLSIGTTLASGGSGVANIAYAAVFDRVLSDAEIAASYASLKAFLATRGVTVS